MESNNTQKKIQNIHSQVTQKRKSIITFSSLFFIHRRRQSLVFQSLESMHH